MLLQLTMCVACLILHTFTGTFDDEYLAICATFHSPGSTSTSTVEVTIKRRRECTTYEYCCDLLVTSVAQLERLLITPSVLSERPTREALNEK